MNKATNPPETPADAGEKMLRDLIARAKKGDASTLPLLRKMMQQPGFENLCGGALDREAELSLIRSIAGKDLAFEEGIIRKLELLRAELTGADATPAERLLAERTAACWLQLAAADIQYAQMKDATFAQGEYAQCKMDRANKRFLQAVKTLELVRRLAVPVLRIERPKPALRLAGHASEQSA